MKKIVYLAVALIAVFVVSETAYAKGRTGSVRVGGYNSHGKGSCYIGGYVR